MRVALVSPYDLGRFGGVQDQCLKLADWLVAAGHEAFVLGPGAGPAGTLSIGDVREVPANGARTPIAVEPGIKKRIEEATAGVDVVHIHEPLMPMVGLAALAADTPAKVGTFHADPPAWVRRFYRAARPVLSSRLARLDAVTAVSPVAASAMRRLVPNVTIVPNGIDVDDYAGGGERLRDRVVFVGRDDPRKGLPVLLEAWETVVEGHPAARLHVVGAEGEDTATVSFLGRVSEEQKRAELAEATVAVAPNLGGESFGIVVVEAMAAGCAVVASGLPAFTAVGGDAIDLVPPGDPFSLGSAIVNLLDDPDRAASRGASALERSRRFDRDAVLAAYLEVYTRAVAAVPERGR